VISDKFDTMVLKKKIENVCSRSGGFKLFMFFIASNQKKNTGRQRFLFSLR
jgi:hypothetical protein